MAKIGALQASRGIVTWLLAVCMTAPLAALGQAQEEETIGEDLGRLAAYARRCGYHDDAGWLQANFGELPGFQRARKETTLYFEGYEIVQIRCGRIRRAVEEVKGFMDPEQE